MSPEQEAHLKRIKAQFAHKADLKYRDGQKEHGGNLKDVSLLDLVDSAIAEAIDQVIYLETIRENLVGVA